MRTRLKFLLIISFFVLSYAAYYWVVPFVVNIKSRVTLIQSIVKKELGPVVEIQNPELKMGLVPSLWLDAKSLSIKDKKSPPLYILNPKIKIRLLPLLVGKIHVAYFSCDKITVDLKLDKKSRLYIGNYPFVLVSNSKISIENSKMDVEGYKIKFKDEVRNKDILLNGDYFNLEKFNSKKYIKCSTNSKLKVNDRYSTINADIDFKLPFKKGLDTNEIMFDGAITNLNLDDLSAYINKLSDGSIKQTSGILNIEADTNILSRKTTQIKTQMTIKDLLIAPKNSPSIYFKNKLNVISVIEASKNVLKVNDLKFSSGRMNAEIKGKINRISSKNPVLDLSVVIDKSTTEDFISLLPAMNFKNIDIDIIKLKKYGFYSDIDGKISVRGHSDNPRISGDLLLENGYLIKPLPASISKSTIKLKFLGNKLDLDILVPVGRSEKFSVKGLIDLYGDKKNDLVVSSTSNIDLSVTQSILNPSHEIFYFDVGPLPIIKLQGKGNMNLKIKGTKFDPHIFGEFNLKDATAVFNGINVPIKNINSKLYFKDKETIYVTNSSYFGGKPINLKGKCKLWGDLEYDIVANEQELQNLLDVINNSPIFENARKSVSMIKNAGGKINANLKLKGKVTSPNDFAFGKTVVISGNVKLLGNSVSLNNLQTSVKNLYGSVKFKGTDADFDLYSFVDKSKVYIKGKIRNKVLNSKIKLDDIAFTVADIPVKIHSGNLEINNDKLSFYKVNAMLDMMPVLVDGTIVDIFKTPDFNLYVNSKPSQKFIEKYVNKNTTYPLKIKGDISCSSRIEGTKDSFNTKTEMNLQEGANIYYMGSTLGDSNNPIRIFLDADISKYYVYVNSFQYDKLISSQNDKEFVSQQLNAKGQISYDKNNIAFRNFRVKTQNPTDAKLFNILFKKPLIKQGLFTSNVLINNSISSPQLNGDLNFTGIDIPLLDTTIKDISLDFRDKDIDIKAKGEVFSNQIILSANMENRLIPPYTLNYMDIYLGNLDINQIVKRLDKLDLESNMNKISEQKNNNSGIGITDLMIKNAKVKAQSVLLKNIVAQDLVADFSLNEKLLFSVDDFKFSVAPGNINGNFKYNLLNSKSELELHVDSVDANQMAEALFDLPEQVSGSVTGQVDISCNGKSHKTCMDTLSGKGGFSIKDGRMPKLGSLEYLLKASNLVKSGVTGLTINSLIELVSPLKTGQFENINGMFSIKSGIAEDIQIFSKGKDLSLFLTGTYNFSTLVADMNIYGRLSKKISNILGPVGNTSLNTFFNLIPGLNLEETNKADFVKNVNKIPGFELNDKTYRIFSAEIYGDINGENYVQSFKWVE